VRVRYVADAPLSHETEAILTTKLCDQLGAQTVVTFERVEAVELSSSGKFMVTRSEIAGS
jgi:hypothetical protein